MERRETRVEFSLHLVKTQKVAVYSPGKELLPGTESADALILNFPASRALKNGCLSYFVMAA